MYFSAEMSDFLTSLLVDIVFLSGGGKTVFVLLVLGLSLFFLYVTIKTSDSAPAIHNVSVKSATL